jgi:CBS domain-containing protein
MKVESIMTRKPILAKVPGKREDVLNLMIRHKKTGLPVTKKDGTLVGLVARKHLFQKPDETQLAMLVRKDHPSIEKDVDVADAAKLILDNDLHHLPVTNRRSKVVGIVTPADFLGFIEDIDSEKPAIDYVRACCVAAYEDTPITVASEILRLGKVFALPVLNKKAKLSGIVTDRDIFALAIVDKKRRSMSKFGLPREEDPWNYEGLRNILRLFYDEKKVKLPDIKLKDIMIKDPTTVFKNTGLSEAARIMRRKDFGQLPVTDARDRLLAVLYDIDLLVAVTEEED